MQWNNRGSTGPFSFTVCVCVCETETCRQRGGDRPQCSRAVLVSWMGRTVTQSQLQKTHTQNTLHLSVRLLAEVAALSVLHFSLPPLARSRLWKYGWWCI